MQTSSDLVCKEHRKGKDGNNIFPRQFYYCVLSLVYNKTWFKKSYPIFANKFLYQKKFCVQINVYIFLLSKFDFKLISKNQSDLNFYVGNLYLYQYHISCSFNVITISYNNILNPEFSNKSPWKYFIKGKFNFSVKNVGHKHQRGFLVYK